MGKDEEIVKIPYRNFIEIPKKDITSTGIKMAMDLIEEITGIHYDMTEYLGCQNEKERLYFFENYLIQVFKEKFGLMIKICGNCGKFRKDFSDIASGSIDGYCVLDNSIRRFGWPCKNDKLGDGGNWIPKEIPKERKEERK